MTEVTIKVDGREFLVRYDSTTEAKCLSFWETVACLVKASDVALAAEMGEFELV